MPVTLELPIPAMLLMSTASHWGTQQAVALIKGTGEVVLPASHCNNFKDEGLEGKHVGETEKGFTELNNQGNQTGL